jgi:large subunit ribosomal protein L15
MIRKTKKICKMRGSRTVGGGCSKMRRGAGHRGGRGMSGGHKHMWTWIVKYDPNHYGKYGFKRPQKTITRFNTVNLDFIDEKAGELLGKDLAIQENGIIVIDVTELGYNKVLGKGRITQPLRIKSPKFSQTALTKIENAGGEAVVI